ncbi:MAG: NAD-dependent epimerase/dehydratase family protein, partial [Chitinophagaceae bacterium]
MILVTGASGFVGGHFLKKLAATGASIRALYHNHLPDATMLIWPNVQWQKADLLDVFDVEEVMRNIKQVYHCAAIVSFDPTDKQRMVHTNTEICANLVNAALDAGVDKFLQISSIAALGRDGTGREVNEEAQWEESAYNSAYGLSKYLAELEVWRGIGEGLNAVIVNPGIILGAPLQKAGWKHGSPKLMQTVFKGFPFYTDGITSFVAVQDVVEVGIRLMQSSISAERFVLSAG